MTDNRFNGWGRVAIGVVISALLASGFWQVLYADRPTRAQVQEMVDRDSVLTRQALQELKVELREVNAKLNLMREELARRR